MNDWTNLAYRTQTTQLQTARFRVYQDLQLNHRKIVSRKIRPAVRFSWPFTTSQILNGFLPIRNQPQNKGNCPSPKFTRLPDYRTESLPMLNSTYRTTKPSLTQPKTTLNPVNAFKSGQTCNPTQAIRSGYQSTDADALPNLTAKKRKLGFSTKLD